MGHDLSIRKKNTKSQSGWYTPKSFDYNNYTSSLFKSNGPNCFDVKKIIVINDTFYLEARNFKILIVSSFKCNFSPLK